MQQPKGFKEYSISTEDINLLDKRRLVFEIEQLQQQNLKMDEKIQLYTKELKKMSQSNERNAKRLMRHRLKLKQLYNNRNQPEYFLQICGFMNEYMQEFIITHDVQIMGNNSNEEPNVDNMSYEQLLELGESIGKVSKGILKEDFERLPRKKNISSDQNCPICCTQFNLDEIAIVLSCKHLYHDECIRQWLKDQNTCPICKKNVLDK